MKTFAFIIALGYALCAGLADLADNRTHTSATAGSSYETTR